MARTDYGAILSTVIKDTSDAVREVNGTSSLIAPNQWGTAIRTMHSDSDYENALEQMIEETASGDIASFSDGANNIPCPSVLCTINPFQSGSGDPSPSNVRPITGHTELNLVHTGANLLNPTTCEGGFVDYSTGEITPPTGNKEFVTPFIPISAGVQFAFSFTINNSDSKWYRIGYYDENKGYLSQASENLGTNTYYSVVKTAPTNTKYIRVSWRNFSDTITNIQLELGSTATAYEPYTGSTTTTDFGTTVYGGTLDPVSGVLTTTKAQVDLGTLDWSIAGTGDGQIFTTTLTDSKEYSTADTPNAICENYKPVSWTYMSNNPTVEKIFSMAYSQKYLAVKDHTYTDVATFKTAMSGVKLVYELATPTTTQLTPQEVKSLLGGNNIYHDCNGQVAVTYRANGQLYVEQH